MQDQARTLTRLILVRHGKPQVSAAVPSEDWELAPEGRQAVRQLASKLPRGARIMASTEIKAIQTAEELTGVRPIETDERLCEVRRPFIDDPAQFQAAGQHYLEGDAVPGWEPAGDVVARMWEALKSRPGDEDMPLVAVTHGTAMTLWLASAGEMPFVYGFWRGLAFAEGWDVRLDGSRVATVKRL